jgi:dihydrofolate reductase
MKQEPGPGMVILGSGQIVAQLAQAGLIDSYQIVIVPILLGKGRSLFDGVTGKPRLKLTKTRAFGNRSIPPAWSQCMWVSSRSVTSAGMMPRGAIASDGVM